MFPENKKSWKDLNVGMGRGMEKIMLAAMSKIDQTRASMSAGYIITEEMILFQTRVRQWRR